MLIIGNMRRGNVGGRPNAGGGGKAGGGPMLFRPTNKSLEDLLDPDCLDDQTRRMLVGQIMNPPRAYGVDTPDQKSESSLSFLERLHEAGGVTAYVQNGRELPAPPGSASSPASPYSPNSSGGSNDGVKYPSTLRSKVKNGSDEVITSMAARLRDLEQKHKAYQCELKEMHDKYRQANDMLQKARRQNEEHENTIVTLDETRQDMEKELNAMKAFLASKGLSWDRQKGTAVAMHPGAGVCVLEPTGGQRLGGQEASSSPSQQQKEGEERNSAAPSNFDLYDGNCEQDKTMDEATAEALLAASGPRFFPNSAKQRGAQLYSRRREKNVSDSTDNPHRPPPETAEDTPPPNVDIELLQRNAKILSDYVGWKHVVTDGSKGHIRDRDVVRLVVYKNGICVNSGPFRPFGWPLCEAFLQDLAEGYYPYEFKDKYPDGYPIEVTNKQDEVCDPTKTTKPPGHRLVTDGSYQPVSTSEFLNKLPEKRVTASGRVIDVRDAIASIIGASEKKAVSPIEHVTKAEKASATAGAIDVSKAVKPPLDAKAEKLRPGGWAASGTRTVVLGDGKHPGRASSPQRGEEAKKEAGDAGSLVPLIIRVPSGQQVSMKLSSHDTIEVLREEFMAAVPEYNGRGFELCQAFPSKTFTEHSKTLADYGLIKSSVLMVRLLK